MGWGTHDAILYPNESAHLQPGNPERPGVRLVGAHGRREARRCDGVRDTARIKRRAVKLHLGTHDYGGTLNAHLGPTKAAGALECNTCACNL